ncbi:nitroreductase family protein [Pontibacillus litoralis]|uniref:NAD(P)H nitroreductase n=1 Tax=Pontibacillus litoralis JSM 072002 TaxID=1385512 RepID=A0A0A5HVL5_9BACI|nr:nitroreductase family protein [Pontibacillus litoralis]KGX87692.1 NAD(P)H nitroreductase [Pontibacillus litoralis JSM 072002]
MQDKTASKEDMLNKGNEFSTGEKPKVLTTTDFFTVAEERRSVRKYDTNYKMDEKEIRDILEAAILAPSSSNLQSWRFLVIEDQEAKEKLLPMAFNQQQVVEASAVIAVLGKEDAYKDANKIYGQLVENGSLPEEAKEGYVNNIVDMYSSASRDKRTRIAMIDGGLISMQLMLAAKAKGLDTVPMGGFDEKAFVEAFNVPENYEPVMLIALGKGEVAGFPKNRLPLDDILAWNKYE